jgi:hypothetical protein
MPRRKPGELTEFLRALRRRARQARRLAVHSEEAARLRDFASYLDGHAEALRAKAPGRSQWATPSR